MRQVFYVLPYADDTILLLLPSLECYTGKIDTHSKQRLGREAFTLCIPIIEKLGSLREAEATLIVYQGKFKGKAIIIDSCDGSLSQTTHNLTTRQSNFLLCFI